MLERSLDERGGEGRVDDGDRTANGSDLVEIDEIEPGVGRRLGEHERGAARLHRGRERAGLGAVDEGDVDAEPWARALQQQLRAGVELTLGHDVVALRAEAEHDRRDRTHARREGAGALGALEVGDGVLEAAHRRVAVPAVEPVRARHRGHAPALLDGGRDEGRRGPQDRGQRGVVVGPPGPDRPGLDVERVGVAVGISHGASPPRRGRR